MTKLGLDFDNTLIHYDNLFHKLATEKGLISSSVASNKIAIRDFLRKNKKDKEFTLLQGEVYGKKILEAEPAKDVVKTLKALQQKGISLVVVSHKTKTPYKGPAYDLHRAAVSWFEKHKFFSKDGLGWEYSQIYFEKTKEEKIAKIKALGCTHYVDDLPEIIKALPESLKGILYDPKNIYEGHTGPKIEKWNEIETVINKENTHAT